MVSKWTSAISVLSGHAGSLGLSTGDMQEWGFYSQDLFLTWASACCLLFVEIEFQQNQITILKDASITLKPCAHKWSEQACPSTLLQQGPSPCQIDLPLEWVLALIG